MADLVLLKEVSGELAQYLDRMGKNPEAGPAIKELLIDAKEDREKFPKLFAFIEQARADANNASRLDSPIPFPDEIIISPEVASGAHLKVATYADGREAASLGIHPNLISYVSHTMLTGTISHEFEHYHHHAQSKGGVSADQRRIFELEADRAAQDPLVKAVDLLYMSRVKHYDSVPIDAPHPPVKARVRALLEEAYANDLFRKSGRFDENFHFYPERQDFRPVTEGGKKVLNWDNEIYPALQTAVNQDMKRLDAIMASMPNQETRADENALIDFQAYLETRVSDFRQKHVPQLENPSPDYLALSFRDALKGAINREAVMAMHEGMPNAFAAYDMVAEFSAKQLVSSNLQMQVTQRVEEQLVNGIRKGEYPDMSSSVNTDHASAVDFDLQK